MPFSPACVVVAMLFLSCSSSAETLSQVIDLECDYLPPVCMGQDSDMPGMMLEIGSEAVRRAGFVPQVRIRPWKRAMQDVVGSSNVLMIYLARTPQREALFKWIAITNDNGFSFISREGEPPVNSLQQASAGGLIGIRAGSSVREWLLRQGIKDEQLTESPLEQMARMLKAGRVSSFFGTPLTFVPLYTSLIGSRPVVGTVIYRDHNWIAAGPKFPAAVAGRIARAVNSMKQDGYIDRIVAKYSR